MIDNIKFGLSFIIRNTTLIIELKLIEVEEKAENNSVKEKAKAKEKYEKILAKGKAILAKEKTIKLFKNCFNNKPYKKFNPGRKSKTKISVSYNLSKRLNLPEKLTEYENMDAVKKFIKDEYDIISEKIRKFPEKNIRI